MGIRIEPATAEHFHQVYHRLLRPLNDRIPEATWKRLFEQPWADEGDLLGQVLLDGSRPVGYAAFVHGRFPGPAGDPERSEHVCNVSTWVVEPAYGHRAPALIVPVLRMNDVTVTNLTNIPSVHEMFTKLGFRELESWVRILAPFPFDPSSWGHVEIETDPTRIIRSLSGRERRIAEDHAFCCHHLFIREAGGRHCYVIFTMGRRKRMRTARLYWVTPGALEQASVPLRRALYHRFGCVLAELDDRWAPRSLPGSFRIRLPVPRVYRSSRLQPPEVPSVYSELPLLEL